MVERHKIMSNTGTGDRDWLVTGSFSTRVRDCQMKLVGVRFKTNRRLWFFVQQLVGAQRSCLHALWTEEVCLLWSGYWISIWKSDPLGVTKLKNRYRLRNVLPLKTVEAWKSNRRKCNVCLLCLYSSVCVCWWPFSQPEFWAQGTLSLNQHSHSYGWYWNYICLLLRIKFSILLKEDESPSGLFPVFLMIFLQNYCVLKSRKGSSICIWTLMKCSIKAFLITLGVCCV